MTKNQLNKIVRCFDEMSESENNLENITRIVSLAKQHDNIRLKLVLYFGSDCEMAVLTHAFNHKMLDEMVESQKRYTESVRDDFERIKVSGLEEVS